MAKCTLVQKVISTAPGMAGNWEYTLGINLVRVLVAGEDVCWDGDWASLVVKRVTISEEFASVDLVPVRMDDSEVIKELDSMPGWKRHGGPWKGQT